MSGFQGAQQSATALHPQAVTDFHIKSSQAKMWTSTLVKVVSVTNSGGLSPSGTVDIMPLVNQIDGAGNAQPHGVIHACPYSRMQGGNFAIILDPQVGDIGIAVFASRDISSATANKGQSNPGSRRQFDPSDGLYVGGCLNGTPTAFVQFQASGITIHHPSKITIDAPQIALNGQITQTQNAGGGTGAVSMTGPVTVTNELTANGHTVSAHHHTQPADSHGDTEQPTSTPVG
jgi:hypothetical protein